MMSFMAILAASIAACSAKPSPPAGTAGPQEPPAVPEMVPPPGPAPAAGDAPPASPAGPGPLDSTGEIGSDLTVMLAKVGALEDEARFAEALALLARLEQPFRGHPNFPAVAEAAERITRERDGAAEVARVVDRLGSADAGVVEAARARLLAAGDAGGVFLRKALREANAKTAAEAAQLLAARKDAKSAGAMIERLERAGSEPLRDILAGSLIELARGDEAHLLGEFLRLLVTDADNGTFAYRALAGHLCRELEQTCAGDPARLDGLVGRAGAGETLRAYVRRAIMADDPKVVAWAGTCALAVGLSVRGLRGSYYEGVGFEKLAFERLDSRIDVPNRKFPYPDGRQDNISVRWTGQLEVAAAGDYTFFSASDDGQRVWIDGRLLIDDWNIHGTLERMGRASLAPGLHDFKVEFFQGGGGASITVWYQGPGVARQVITDSVLLTLPWAGMNP